MRPLFLAIRQLWAGAVNSVINATVYRRRAGVMRHNDLGRSPPDVAMRIRHLKGDRIDAAVAVTLALSAQLNRLTIGSDNNIVRGVTVTIAVLDFVAGDLLNDDVTNADAATVVTGSGYELSQLEGGVFMVRRPH